MHPKLSDRVICDRLRNGCKSRNMLIKEMVRAYGYEGKCPGFSFCYFVFSSSSVVNGYHQWRPLSGHVIFTVLAPFATCFIRQEQSESGKANESKSNFNELPGLMRT